MTMWGQLNAVQGRMVALPPAHSGSGMAFPVGGQRTRPLVVSNCRWSAWNPLGSGLGIASGPPLSPHVGSSAGPLLPHSQSRAPAPAGASFLLKEASPWVPWPPGWPGLSLGLQEVAEHQARLHPVFLEVLS